MAVKIQLNRQAVRQLLNGREVQADLERRASRIAQAAGPGYTHEVAPGRNRARAGVYVEDAALAGSGPKQAAKIKNAIRSGR